MSQDELDNLRRRYGLDLQVYVQYFKWLLNVLQGEFGQSFQLNRPVKDIIGERLGLTVAISLSTLVFTYVMAIPIGIYSATHQYSTGDCFFMSVGFVGLATPNFLLALIVMFVLLKLGFSVGGCSLPSTSALRGAAGREARAGWVLRILTADDVPDLHAGR